MWRILQTIFTRVNEDDEAGKALYEEFLAEQFHKYKAVDEYAAKLRNYHSQLANIMEKRLTDRSLTQQLIKGLSYQCDDIVSTIMANKSEFRQAIQMMNERERTRGQCRQSKAFVARSGKANASAKALVGTTESSSQNQQNHRKPHRKNNRGKPYHHRYQRGYQPQDNQPPPRTIYDPKMQCWYCARMGHLQQECRTCMNAERLRKEGPQAQAQAQVSAPASQKLFAAIAHDSIAMVQNDPTLAANINELIATGSNNLPLATSLEDSVCFNAD